MFNCMRYKAKGVQYYPLASVTKFLILMEQCLNEMSNFNFKSYSKKLRATVHLEIKKNLFKSNHELSFLKTFCMFFLRVGFQDEPAVCY